MPWANDPPVQKHIDVCGGGKAGVGGGRDQALKNQKGRASSLPRKIFAKKYIPDRPMI